MSRYMLAYVKGDSPVHRLAGEVKFIIFLLWSALVMTSYDTRIMAAMGALGVFLFVLSGIRLRNVSFIFKLLFFFMFLNLLTIYLFAPEQGVLVYGSRHLLVSGMGLYTLTAEQLF
jgi:energy-coupling factor transport system permease protein